MASLLRRFWGSGSAALNRRDLNSLPAATGLGGVSARPRTVAEANMLHEIKLNLPNTSNKFKTSILLIRHPYAGTC